MEIRRYLTQNNASKLQIEQAQHGKKGVINQKNSSNEHFENRKII
jgi:hypothetical protein